MATYQRIQQLRLKRALSRQAIGKASAAELRLLARFEMKQKREAEEAERKRLCDEAIAK